MRLRNGWLTLLVSLSFALSVGGAQESPPTQARERAAPSEAEIERAIQKLTADPNLATERKTRVLKWKTGEQKESRKSTTPGWLRWIGELFRWFGETARILVWLAAGLLAALLAVLILRFVRNFDPSGAIAAASLAPTHVRDLDIRPESLPDDIGGAALALWERGRHRDALSLLYRGLLSRLAHRHDVPIKHSSTEGECRALALQKLPATSHAYVVALIRTWQDAVYGGSDPASERMRRLCDEFAVLDRAEPNQSEQPRGLAGSLGS